MELKTKKRSAGKLATPRRNRYFFGKLLDEHHFQLEQSYLNEKRWLMNRLTQGTGVLCGLQVELLDGLKIVVQPGVAIDPFGREIIVPNPVCLDLKSMLPDVKPGDKPLSATLCLHYHECETEMTPVLACGCDTPKEGMPSTVEEKFRMSLEKGLPDKKPGLLTVDQCNKLFSDTTENKKDRRSLMCEYLSPECSAELDDYVVLGTLLYNPEEKPSVQLDACSYRSIIYSNEMLMDLVLCMARRLDECCDRAPVEVDPPRLTQIDFLDTSGDKIDTLKGPGTPAVFEQEKNLHQFRMVFDAAMDPDSFFTGGSQDNPIHFSVLVTNLADQSAVPGRIEFENDRMVRFVLSDEHSADRFAPGRYHVTLFGDEDPTGARFSIKGQNGVRLDGESTQLPSGDGTEGGNFVFQFEILDDKLVVEQVYFMRTDNVLADSLTNPAEPVFIPYNKGENGIRRIRISFNKDVDVESIIASGKEPATFSVLITETPLKEPPQLEDVFKVTTSFLSPNVVDFLVEEVYPPGEYHMTLFGDLDSAGKHVSIVDQDGNRLDGDPKGLPSGDGNEGGNFTFRFAITT